MGTVAEACGLWVDRDGAGDGTALLEALAGDKRQRRRAAREAAHGWERKMSSLKRVRLCGVPVRPEVVVGVWNHGGDLVAHVAGLGRCGSPWACANCAPVVREGRATEIDAGVREALARGWTVLFITTTVPHSWADALERSFRLVSDGHRRTRSGRGWQALRKGLDYRGGIRAWEATHGGNGWHPHCHELLMFGRRLSDGDVEAVHEHYRRTYGQAVERGAGARLHPVHGIDVRRCTGAGDLGGYLTKVEGGWGTGLELARGDLKRAPGKRSPWEILEDAAAGDVEARRLWWEWEAGTDGKRAIMWSAGLRGELLPAEAEPTDEELAARPPTDELPLWTCTYPADVWCMMRRAGAISELLAECEARAAALHPPPG